MVRTYGWMFSLLLVIFSASLAGFSSDAAAKRLGGGKSFGMQRQATPPASAPAQSTTAGGPSAAGAATTTAAAPKRSWLGPVAGLAAGLGLAALVSHLGFGEEMASFVLFALIGLALLFVLRRLLGPKRSTNDPMAYAGAGFGQPQGQPQSLPTTPGSPPSSGARIPADFDAEGFVRQAKLNFIRLQAANDRGDLDDIREFSTPEFFAEVRMQFEERGRGAQQTDLVTLESEVLDVATEGARHVVSIRFHGLLREDGPDGAATPFDEIWHLVKPTDGTRGWSVAGIQQRQ